MECFLTSPSYYPESFDKKYVLAGLLTYSTFEAFPIPLRKK